jgi:predicted lipid-binding transport protein (Tim44 family)
MMVFRYYTNAISQATKAVAKGILLAGLTLIGLGALILALPELFAALVAALLIVVGLGFVATAGKIFFQNRRIEKQDPDARDAYRNNVQIHIEEHHDM